MPLRFHSERKSVNTQSPKSRDQAYTGLAPTLLTRYKKLSMPTHTPRNATRVLSPFQFLSPISLLPTFPSELMSNSSEFKINPSPSPFPLQSNLSHQFQFKATSPSQIQLDISSLHPTMLNSFVIDSPHPLIPPLLFYVVCILFLSFSQSSTHYIRIITPLRFSIISCYQFALINTTFLLSSYYRINSSSLKLWPEKIRIRNRPLKRPFRRNDQPLLKLLAQQ